MDKVKHEFVRRCLEEQKGEVTKAQLSKINTLLKMRSGTLQRRNVEVDGGNSAYDGNLTITHPAYERFLDMKLKSKNSKKLATRKKKKLGDKSRLAFPIHNRPIMRSFNALSYKLLYFLTAETYEQIKQELETKTA